MVREMYKYLEEVDVEVHVLSRTSIHDSKQVEKDIIVIVIVIVGP